MDGCTFRYWNVVYNVVMTIHIIKFNNTVIHLSDIKKLERKREKKANVNTFFMNCKISVLECQLCFTSKY